MSVATSSSSVESEEDDAGDASCDDLSHAEHWKHDDSSADEHPDAQGHCCISDVDPGADKDRAIGSRDGEGCFSI